MSVWSGWQKDLLQAGGFPNTGNNRRFLSDWHLNAETNCKLNPVDISHGAQGSSDCATLPGQSADAQDFPNKIATMTAFQAQIGHSAYRYIAVALASGNPFSYHYSAAVGDDMVAWGSPTAGQFYFNQTPAGGGGGPGPGLGNAGDVLKAWGDLQRSVNHRLPHALHHSQISRKAALRELARASKVRL